MASLHALGLAVVVALAGVTVTSPASAAEPATLSLAAAPGYAGASVPLSVVLEVDGGPVVGAPVVVERMTDGGWMRVDEVVTDADGTAATTATRSRDADDNTFRATYAGDDEHDPALSREVTSRLLLRRGVVTLDGPGSVRDGRSVRLRVTWASGSGDPVAGEVVVQRWTRGSGWQRYAGVRTGARGKASLEVRPRVDSAWRAVSPSLDWLAADHSPAHALDNRPPGQPVDLPRGAPSPRVSVPPQPRATGAGAHAVVRPIPDGVWRSMTGRSWHRGCPVGRAGLRLLRVNYWGYDGYRYRGEVVAATGAVDHIARALTAMYDRRFPIRSMYRVDRFGWSKRLQGADDYRSMAAGNTSAFNCRWVVNNPGVRSPHSYGRALDVNTWENPYRSATGLVPNAWWQSRSHPRVAWRSRDHAVVRLFLAHGFSWTYGTGDSQHFDVRGGDARLVAPDPSRCGGFACH